MEPHQPPSAAARPFRELDDSEWKLLAALLPCPLDSALQRGRPRADPRATVNALLWVLWTGKSWLSLPKHYPSPPTCRRRYGQWQDQGLWQEIRRRLECQGRTIQHSGARTPCLADAGAPPATFWSALLD